ncbi:hypothetical protein G7Y79_00007g022330 [Physcia stellaris]|nr:hypothetical protein G7Y79_00007g022330 [Physcia stellaris]
MAIPIISDFEKQRRENATRSAGIKRPKHLSYNFYDPSRVYLRYRRDSFQRNRGDESVSSGDIEDEDDLEEEEEEEDERDENASSKDDEGDESLDEGDSEEDEQGDYDKDEYENGIDVSNQATKAHSISSEIINEDNSEFDPDYMELSDEGSDEDEEDQEDMSEDILDETSKEHSMEPRILNVDEFGNWSDDMELGDDGILLAGREVRSRTGAIS